MSPHLLGPLQGLGRKVLEHQAPPDQVREEVAEGCSQRWAEADQEQCQWERKEETRKDAEEDWAWDRKGLQEDVGEKEARCDGEEITISVSVEHLSQALGILYISRQLHVLLFRRFQCREIPVD